MKKILLIAFLATTSACEAIKDEAGYLGGYPERVANEKIFEARSQRQRADRYFMSLVILAPLAADLIQSDAEASAAATLINKAYRNLHLMYEAAGKCLSEAGDSGCPKSSEVTNTAFVFETHAYEMQRTLYALSKQTLGAADLDDIADDIVSLNIFAIYKTLKKAFPVARRILATYRDTVITFGDAIAISCKKEDERQPKTCDKLRQQITQLRDGLRPGYLEFEPQNDRLVFAMLASMKKASRNGESGQQWRLGNQHILGLIYHIDRACRSLTTEQLTDEVLTDTPDASDIAKIINCGKELKIGETPIIISSSREKFRKTAIEEKPSASAN